MANLFTYIDTHAHVNLRAFDEDRESVLLRLEEEGVAHINIGTQQRTSQKAVEIAEAHATAYAIVGLHPIQTVPGVHDEDEIGKGGTPFSSTGEVFNTDYYRALAQSKKVVGIGECGFDYWHCPKESYAVQEQAFIAQIALANELGLPLMIHTRGPKKGEESPTGRSVYLDVYEVLKQYAKVPFNVHFYAGTFDEAKQFFDIGGTISFTGVITFAQAYEEIIKNTPLELLHAETDCPFVAPVPYRGQRCDPSMVKEVYKKIAEIKTMDEETIRMQLIANAKTLYRLS
jgi:TatD DNase family protein